MLTHHDHDLALTSLVPREAAIDAVLAAVGRLDVATEIAAIDLDCLALAAELPSIQFQCHRLAQLVRQNERRLVLAVRITGKGQGLTC